MSLKAPTESKRKSTPAFSDDASSLSPAERALVISAMERGLTEFSIPTPGLDHDRTDWKVRTFVALRDGQPTAFLVAYQPLATYIEVAGPELDPDGQIVKQAKPNAVRELQRR